MKNLILILAGLITGFLVSSYYFKHKAPPNPSFKKEKFQDLIEGEMKTFAEATDAEAKLKAAEELYGKMTVLFLAELGLRAVEINSTTQDPESINDSVENSSPEVSQVSEGEVFVHEMRPAVEASKENVKEGSVKESKVDSGPGSIGHYLATPYLKSLPENARKLIGSFAGSITHKAGKYKGRVDTVNLSFHLNEEAGVLQGDSMVILTDPDGFEYSRSNGQGPNKSLKGIKGTEESFYIEVSPNSYFLLNLREYPLITGQYFDNYGPLGSVTLRKIE